MDIIEQATALMLTLGASPVLYLLLALSAIGLGIAIERAWYFGRRTDDLGELAQKFDVHLAAGDLDGARLRLTSSAAVEARVVLAGLDKLDVSREATAGAMDAALLVERLKMERGLAFLGTLGNNAPFIGLLGTVVGIVMAFDQLGQNGMGGSSPSTQVMSSIAEALVATAVGLAVAIPSVAAYNYFQRRIRAFASNAQALGHILTSWKAEG